MNIKVEIFCILCGFREKYLISGIVTGGKESWNPRSQKLLRLFISMLFDKTIKQGRCHFNGYYCMDSRFHSIFLTESNLKGIKVVSEIVRQIISTSSVGWLRNLGDEPIVDLPNQFDQSGRREEIGFWMVLKSHLRSANNGSIFHGSRNPTKVTLLYGKNLPRNPQALRCKCDNPTYNVIDWEREYNLNLRRLSSTLRVIL